MKTRGYGTDCVICRSVIWDGSSDNRSFATNCFPSFFFRTTTHIFFIYTRWVSPTCCCCCVSIPDDDSLCWWKKIRAIIRIEFLFMLRSDKKQNKNYRQRNRTLRAYSRLSCFCCLGFVHDFLEKWSGRGHNLCCFLVSFFISTQTRNIFLNVQ